MEYREPQGAGVSGVSGRPVSQLADWRGRPPRAMGYEEEAFYDGLRSDDPDDPDDPDDQYGDYGDGLDQYGRSVGPSRLGKLTVLVMMDDQVVDVLQRPVQGSGYECAVLELGRGRPEPAVVPPPPEPPRHERELGWLARLVGGHDVLAPHVVDSWSVR